MLWVGNVLQQGHALCRSNTDDSAIESQRSLNICYAWNAKNEVPCGLHSTHRCTSLAASLSSRKLLRTRDLAMSPSPISFHSHDSKSRRRFSTRSGLLLTPTSLFLEGGSSLAILLFPSSSFNYTHTSIADDARRVGWDTSPFLQSYC